MKATELRIGNLVTFHDKQISIAWEDIRFMCTSKHQDKYHKPIPLTEEWLVKFGFFNNQIEIKNRLIYFCIDFDSDCYIKHVHQLQNLYFALTNKELTL